MSCAGTDANIHIYLLMTFVKDKTEDDSRESDTLTPYYNKNLHQITFINLEFLVFIPSLT